MRSVLTYYYLLSGFEGLSISRSKNTLYALLQSATIQDGGDDKSTARYTRLLGWDVSGVSTETGEGAATLVEEYVVPLPLSDKGNAQGASEALFVGEGVFLVLARDGDGQGGDDNNSKYRLVCFVFSERGRELNGRTDSILLICRQADLVSILPPATNIANTEFDSPMFPIAKDGVLNKTITPAAYLSFVDMIDDDELERFGVHNGQSRFLAPPSLAELVLLRQTKRSNSARRKMGKLGSSTSARR